jgi:DNA-binding transcriptional MocR family regulator
MAPGLRLGFIVSPAALIDRMVAGVRATAWMATPLIAELVARWIADGTAIRLGKERREEAIVRRQIADRILGNHISPAHPASYHAWLRLPQPWTGSNFVHAASKHGIIVTPPDAVSVHPDNPRGVRLCLGAAKDQAELERALRILAKLLNDRNRAE